MSTWQAIVGATTYSLSGGSPFYRVQATGIGIPNVRNIKQKGPSQDGATRRDFRLDERFFNLIFFFDATTLAQADDYRDDLIEIFKPLTDTPVKIKVTRDDAAVRQIDTYVVGMLDLPDTPDQDRMGTSQRILVQLEAPNPIWYNPTLQNLVFDSVVGGTEGLQVPVPVPVDYAPGSIINATQTVNYSGNWKEYPVIIITGPATGAKITNLTTDEVLDFGANVIVAGDTRTIDLRYGTKTVKDAAGALKNSELTSASDLGIWHLEPAPGAVGGINSIKVEASASTSASKVNMQYYLRYIHL